MQFEEKLFSRFYPYNVIDMGKWNLTIYFKQGKDEAFRISNFTLETFLAPKKFNVSGIMVLCLKGFCCILMMGTYGKGV